MYKPILSSAALTFLALNCNAIKLSSNGDEERQAMMASLTDRIEQSTAALEIGDSTKPEMDHDESEDSEESQEDGHCNSGCQPMMMSSCGGCNSGCDDEHDQMVNLPKDAYLDPSIELQAQTLVEDLEPLVIDLGVELDLSAEEIANMESDVLLPAFEKALADLINDNPELAEFMPDVPTNLQSAIDQVLASMDAQHHETDEGAELTTLVTGNGEITSKDSFDQVMMFQELTPTVFFHHSANSTEACDEFEDRWIKLQKDGPGAAYFRLDIDSEIGDELPEETRIAPYFSIQWKHKTVFGDDGSSWTKFRDEVFHTVKQAEENSERSRTTVDPVAQELDISEELAASIASSFGYDLDE